MNINLTIETIEMNCIKITSEEAGSRIYNLDYWTIGAAVENYIDSELEEGEDE